MESRNTDRKNEEQGACEWDRLGIEGVNDETKPILNLGTDEAAYAMAGIPPEDAAVQPVSDAKAWLIKKYGCKGSIHTTRWDEIEVPEMLEAYAAHSRQQDAQRIKLDRAYLVSCPWCGEAMEERAASLQISHLIGHGDEFNAVRQRAEAEVARLTQENELLKQKFTTAQKDAYAIEARLTQENADAWQVVKDACDRDWENETPFQIASIASNAIFWRNEEIRKLREKRDADISAKARKAAHELICTRSVLVAPITASFSEAEDFLEAIILHALTEEEK